MSRRRSRGQPDVRRFDGGCPDCSAYSELIPVSSTVWTLAVRHDSTCPAFAQMQANRRP